MDVHLTTDERDFEKVSKFIYLGALIKENNEAGREVKHRIILGNAYYSVQDSLQKRYFEYIKTVVEIVR